MELYRSVGLGIVMALILWAFDALPAGSSEPTTPNPVSLNCATWASGPHLSAIESIAPTCAAEGT